MRICGVICEYNPFHNGHAYHLAQARALSKADYLVCAMSGSFSQRGEPMLGDKWSRARMALSGGADLVLELPALFAVRPAENFALGGAALLHAMGATALAFGSECGDLAALQKAAALLEEETPAFHAEVRAELAGGATLARARARALAGTLPPETPDMLAQPNSALAVCYLRALRALGSGMEPILIPRIGSGYHDAAPGPLASATAVRAAAETGRWADIRAAVPPPAYALLREAHGQGRLHATGALDTALLATLRAMPLEEIAGLCDVSEGLEHRIQRAAWAAGTREQLLAAVKCKRYTHARLSRILCAALLGITREMALRYPAPTYARVLGFRANARVLLSHLKRNAALPLIAKVASSGLQSDDCFALDLRATDLWALGCASAAARGARGDFLTSPVIV
ncbi:MAG: nucleotidyltransferase family protein [Clostridia bacterium]|nr:nucleotidyltransferase family protein [Clostridia bacterium]